MLSNGRPSISVDELYSRISGEDILRRYVGVEYIPCLIHSPLREDEHPSFSIFYSKDGTVALWKDHASGQAGDAIGLLALMWNCSREDVIHRVWTECDCASRDIVPVTPKQPEPTEIQIKKRKAETEDFNYWLSYGINREWLKFADIVPISHFVLVCGGRCAFYKAAPLAYAFTSKNGVKIYQPESQLKWRSSQRKDYIQLYDKLPESGNLVVVCSSLKDALCLWSQTGIPAIAPQSEGTLLPPHIVDDLKHRFHRCCILYDNDQAGLGYAREAALYTGFENIVLPQFVGGKDVSDLYKAIGNPTEFKHRMITLIDGATVVPETVDDLPF